MDNRKKRNLAILSVVIVLVLPLYFMTIKMEESLARKEALKGARTPAVEDRRFMNMRE
ncbi:MAG: hypothetical protein ACJAT2_001458 [Bacteriovoracaceae bacterium]|jgi:hypothetical protein